MGSVGEFSIPGGTHPQDQEDGEGLRRVTMGLRRAWAFDGGTSGRMRAAIEGQMPW